MEEYKKRTVSLVLAAVVTACGICSGEDFKNTVKSLIFNEISNDTVDAVIFTSRPYESTINVFKKDVNTYVITLPEINTQFKNQPSPKGSVESVDVKTIPYTSSGKGYTKITIRTAPNVKLKAANALFKNTVPEGVTGEKPKRVSEDKKNNMAEGQSLEDIKSNSQSQIPEKQQIQKESEQQAQKPQNQEQFPDLSQADNPIPSDYNEEPQKSDYTLNNNEINGSNNNGYTILYIILGILLIIVVAIYSYIKGKEKIAELTGEQGEFDIDNKPKNQNTSKKSKKTNIKKTIDDLDKKYSNPIKMPSTSDISAPKTPEKAPQPLQEDIVLDLDELFNNIKNQPNQNSENKSPDNERIDLDEFLNLYSEDAAEKNNEYEEIEEITYDGEFLEKFLNQDKITFTNEDISKINKFLVEISEETFDNLNKYTSIAASKPKEMSKKELLEYFVSTYTIDCNVSFSDEDIAALNKLINVEIDSDFITDLRTDPQRVVQMRDEIINHNKKRHKFETKVINVKDSLPDLSKEVKKYSGKYIESEVKKEAVDYNKNCEVRTLSIHDELPDLSKEINNKDAYKSRPSDKFDIAVSGYKVEKIHVADQLPDLNDVIANPKKYEEKAKSNDVDEKALIDSLLNVNFKPIYEKEDEILNQERMEPDDEKDFAEFFENEPPLKKKRTFKNRNISENFEKNKIPVPEVCVIDDYEYKIVSSCNITGQKGCYLAKESEGYCIIAFNGEYVKKIKSYNNLKTEKIQIRIDEQLADGTLRCLVKTGLNKFIMNFTENDMEYVMNLC